MGLKKENILASCFERTESRKKEILSAMEIAKDSILNDTKSSMGDKYETSREMAQQELNRLQTQLRQAEHDLDILSQIGLSPTEVISLGSLIVTQEFQYFIAISIGPLKIDNETVMVISRESPIGKLFLGKKKGDNFTINDKNIQIISLL